MDFAAIILAAGQSRRMGQPKLLLPWGETTILGHLLQQWQRLGARQIAVVCGANDQSLSRELERLGFSADNRIVNPSPERGMFSSIQCAARWPCWDQTITHWSIALGDQPQLPFDLLRSLLQMRAVNPDKICQPRYDGHRRHPILLPRIIFEQLAASTAADFSQFLNSHLSETLWLDSTDPSLALDLDTPEDYQLALSRYCSQE